MCIANNQGDKLARQRSEDSREAEPEDSPDTNKQGDKLARQRSEDSREAEPEDSPDTNDPY